MAERHQQCAGNHHAALAEHTVGQHAAEDGREIHKAGVEAVDLRGERLHTERAEQGFVEALERGIADDVLRMLGQKQVLDHVKNEQCAHPVIREALPHFGKKQEREAARMAEEGR